MANQGPASDPEGFETFVNTVVAQQISTHAASAIMGRVKNSAALHTKDAFKGQ